MTSHKNSILAYAGAVGFVALSMQAACGREEPSDQVARGTAVVIDRASQNLTLAEIESLNGTYGSGCDVASASAWRLPVGDDNSGVTPLEYAAVTTGDEDCQLTLTSVTSEGNETFVAGSVSGANFIPSVPGEGIALGGSFASVPVPFGTPGGGVAFYANAHLSDPDFGENFTVTFTFSDDPAQTPGSITATELTVAAANAAAFDAPDYTLSQQSTFDVAVNTSGEVRTVSGSIMLMHGTFLGDGYILTQEEETTTFAQVDALFRNAVEQNLAVDIAPGTPNITIEADPLAFLVGQTLSPTTNVKVVIARTDRTQLQQNALPTTESGVTAYQVITISIAAPASATPTPPQGSNGGGILDP